MVTFIIIVKCGINVLFKIMHAVFYVLQSLLCTHYVIRKNLKSDFFTVRVGILEIILK